LITHSYGAVEVPKKAVDDDKPEKEVIDDTEQKRLEQEERDKAKIERAHLLSISSNINVYPVLTPYNAHTDWVYNTQGGNVVPVEGLKNINSTEIYYGDGTDKEVLMFARTLAKKSTSSYNNTLREELAAAKAPIFPATGGADSDFTLNFGLIADSYYNRYSTEHASLCTIFRIPKTHMKHMKGFRHINEFFLRKEGNQITMATALIRWNTARILKAMLEPYKEMELDTLDQLPSIRNRLYAIRSYVTDNYSLIGKNDFQEELVSQLNRLTTLQRYTEENPEDSEGIAAMVKELTGTDATTVWAAETNLIRKTEELLNSLEDIAILRWVSIPEDSTAAANAQNDIANLLSVKGIKDLD
jgi:hypothetical protein